MKTRRTQHPHIRSYDRAGATFWKVSFQLLGHQVRVRNFCTAAAAEEFYQAARKSIREGTWVKASGSRLDAMNLNDLYEMYCRKIGHKRSEATVKNGSQAWRTHISPILGMKKPRQIKRRTLALWTDALRDNGLSDNSINVARAELSNVLKLSFHYDLIEAIPSFPKLNARPKKKELFSPNEIKNLLRGFKNSQYQMMALVQYQLALRVNELLGLRHGAFNLEAKTVLIDRQMGRHTKGLRWEDRLKPTKNRKSVTLPLSDGLVEMLRPILAARSADSDGPLWLSTWGNPVSEPSYVGALKKAAKAAGITRPLSSHSLRASMLNYMVNESGLSVQACAYYGRHDAAVLLARYSRPEAKQVFAYFRSDTAPKAALTCDFLAITDGDDQ